MRLFLLHCNILAGAIWTTLTTAHKYPPAITTDIQPQIFVMSDISNEPDDTMSFIRLLVHSDQYNITGMTAVTSYWLNGSTYPDQILETVRAYGKVVDNLNTHSEGTFPTEEYLASIVKSGPEVYGTAGLGVSPLSSGASHLIDVVDGMPEDALLHCSAWGGINTLAETLYHIQHTRSPASVSEFIKRLRIYSISDQDNAGPWIRLNFPSIPYIVSLNGFNQYGLAAWTGISGEQLYGFDRGGPDSALVDQAYISKHFQIGPLGSHYPDIAYIMEGDSPSFMHTMMNGLNGGPYDHPEYGGYGGRYIFQDITRQNMLYNDARDNVTGENGLYFVSNHATIWRWRQAYQDEMSARIQWTIKSKYEEGSHPPVVVVNGSSDSAPLEFDATVEEEVVLDASDSYDPDAGLQGRSLKFRWFQYKEPSDEPHQTSGTAVPELNIQTSSGGRVASMKIPSGAEACYKLLVPHRSPKSVTPVCFQLHVLLEVTGSGMPPIRRYKRAILKIQQKESDGR